MYDKNENKFGDVNLKFEDHRDLFEPDHYQSENDYFPDEDPDYIKMIHENDSYEERHAPQTSEHKTQAAVNSTQVSKKKVGKPKSAAREYHGEKNTDFADKREDSSRESIGHSHKNYDEPESPQVKVYQEVDREKPLRKRRNNKKKASTKQEKSGGMFSGGIPFAYKLGGGIVAVILLIVIGVLLYWDRKAPQVTAKDQSVDYGSSLEVSEMVSAKDNRSKNVNLTIDSIEPEGATISDDGKSVTFSNVGTYTVSISGTDDFKNKTTAKTKIEVIDYIAPTFTDIADSYTVGYGQPVTIYNTAVIVDSAETTDATEASADSTDTNASTEATDTSEAADTTIAATDTSEAADTTIAATDTSEAADTTIAATDTSEATDSSETAVATSDPNYTINVAATDDVSKNVTVTIVSLKPMEKQGNDSFTYQEDKVIFKKLGAYEAVFQATDDDGNATARTVTVNVVDKTAPKFTKVEDSYTVAYGVKVKAVQNKNAKGKTNVINVTAKDAKTDVTLSIASVKPAKKLKEDSYTLKKGKVTFHQVGTYKVTICATDKAKNKVTQQVKVKVVDETEPVLNNVPGTITLKSSATAYDWTKGVTATDEIDGDLTSEIKVDDSAVQFGQAGTYKIRYSVTDNSGNQTSDAALVVVQKKAVAKKSTKASTATKKTTTETSEKKKTN